MCLTGNAHSHPEWGCASREMGMCLTGNGDVPHGKWGCASRGMGMCLTGIGDVPHKECTSSPGMNILTGNAHTSYRVFFFDNSSHADHQDRTATIIIFSVNSYGTEQSF